MIARVRPKIGNYFAAPKTHIEFISTGCRLLDLALGGGWAEGRVANVVGTESSGKTLLMIEAAANFALKHPKGMIKYRESEAAFDQQYAEALGMPVKNIDFGERFDTVEDFFEDLMKVTVKSEDTGRPALYILDSLDALSDRDEMERDLDKGSYGTGKARMMSRLFREQVRAMERSRVTLLIVSQVRDNIGVTFGRKTKRTGGRALDFYASHVVYLAHVRTEKKMIDKVQRPVSITVRAKVDKNKIALPYRECEFSIRFGFGVDDIAACTNFLAECGGLREATGNTDPKKYAEQILHNPKELDRLHSIVERRWYDIERKFLPTQPKYRIEQ